MSKKLLRKMDVPFEIKSDSIQEVEIEVKGSGKKIKVAKFTGFASTFGNEDQGGDVVVRGAFQKSIAESNGETIVLFNHNSDVPIGKGFIKETDEGLVMEAEINLEIEEGRSRMSLVRQGVLKALSIGFNIVKASFNDLGQRLLKEVRLREVSLVAFPMNEEALIFGIKGENNGLDNIEESINEKLFDVFKDVLAAKELGSLKIDSKLSELLINSLKSDDKKNHSEEPDDNSHHSEEPEVKANDIEETMKMMEDLTKAIELV